VNRSTHSNLQPSLLLSAALGSVLLASCAPASLNTTGADSKMEAQQAAPMAADNNSAGSAAREAPSAPAPANAATVPQARPQLIKKAELSLVVQSIDQSLQAIAQITRQQQGDIFGLQDSKPQRNSDRHTASMQIQVPQAQLEATLAALEKLGTVQSRSLTVEDVSNQLVDFQARLRNLRRSEEMLLKIMERSGSMSEVLQVSQELSNIRQSIEQIDAQLKNLQAQVAYSTISLTIAEPIAAAPPLQTPVGLRIQETWGQATHSMGEFTIGLLNFSIWLFVYSPYLLLIGGGAALAYHHFGKPKPTPPATTPVTAAAPKDAF
jgi:hypothetical protein